MSCTLRVKNYKRLKEYLHEDIKNETENKFVKSVHKFIKRNIHFFSELESSNCKKIIICIQHYRNHYNVSWDETFLVF